MVSAIRSTSVRNGENVRDSNGKMDINGKKIS